MTDVKNFRNKVKEYFDKKMYENIQKMFGEPQCNLSEEESIYEELKSNVLKSNEVESKK